MSRCQYRIPISGRNLLPKAVAKWLPNGLHLALSWRMQKAQEAGDRGRVSISPPAAVLGYLDALVRLGIHGKSRSEVAERMVVTEIERMVREGFLKLKR